MGIDRRRLIGMTSNYFQCPVCEGVAEDPITSPCCQIIYCKKCYFDWITSSFEECVRCKQCGVNVEDLTVDEFRGTLKKLYCDLKMKCKSQSCPAVLSIQNYQQHDRNCRSITSRRPVPPNCSCTTDLSTIMRELKSIKSYQNQLQTQISLQKSGYRYYQSVFLTVTATLLGLTTMVFPLFITYGTVALNNEDVLPPQ